MPQLLAYLFAATGAWCLFSPHGFLWLLPPLLLARAAFLTRAAREAGWVVAVFSGSLTLYSVWAFQRAQEPGGIGVLLLGMAPLLQLLAIAVVLVPLLFALRLHRRPPGLTTRSSEQAGR